MSEIKFVYITTQVEFVHQYIDAPDEVSYLRYPHRHIAHITVKLEVFNDDREIEFIMMKHRVNEFLTSLDLINVPHSCETIASKILEFVRSMYGSHRNAVIIVSEDNENGCELHYTWM